jgi:hypothetical protein
MKDWALKTTKNSFTLSVTMRTMSGPQGYHSCRSGSKAATKNIAPVAQLDRVLGYEPSGREFESLRARHKIKGLAGFAG